MKFKKLRWVIKRHPFLYVMRFRLLSKNSNLEKIADENYNKINESSNIPQNYLDVNQRIFETKTNLTDLEKVIKLSIWLKQNIKGGSGLSEPSDKALNTMISGLGGVCSDMAQIFNNFCVINNIKVREWGTTSAPFNKKFGGHSFNEVFISELDKWVLIDVSYNIFFYSDSDTPLSVVEMFMKKRLNRKVTYKSFNDSFEVADENIYKNYLNKFTVPFLICGYRNATYDWYLKKARPFLPIFAIHFFILLTGKSYYYQFPLDNYRRIFTKPVLSEL